MRRGRATKHDSESPCVRLGAAGGFVAVHLSLAQLQGVDVVSRVEHLVFVARLCRKPDAAAEAMAVQVGSHLRTVRCRPKPRWKKGKGCAAVVVVLEHSMAGRESWKGRVEVRGGVEDEKEGSRTCG